MLNYFNGNLQVLLSLDSPPRPIGGVQLLAGVKP